MKEVLLKKESDFNNHAGVELIAQLRNYEYEGRREGEIRIPTSIAFISNNPYLASFNKVLVALKMRGTVLIMIKLD